MTHLLVTNDYPPKVGGIQNYLWEIYRRLPAEEFAILTTPYDGDADFDAAQAYRIERYQHFFLAPIGGVRDHAERMIRDIGADFVLFDPAAPVGHLGPSMSVPYGVILHGAEVTVPTRIPVVRQQFRKTLEGASLLVSASHYATGEAEKLVGHELPSVYVPPGVDVHRFTPATAAERAATRERFGLDPEAPVIVSVSRLVPRKGMDRLVEATARLTPEMPGLQTLIVGRGRVADRLQRQIDRLGAPVRMLGNVADDDLPALVAAADVFAMLCRIRWRGLEQEGFGIVFLEAAAAGVAQVAGRSGGAGEAVVDGETGLVVDDPSDVGEITAALRQLLTDAARRERMATVGRDRVVTDFHYDLLAERLLHAIRNRK